MKKVWLIILIFSLLFSIKASADILSCPSNGDAGIPSGYMEINAQTTNTSMTLIPSVAGITYNVKNTFLSYKYDSVFENIYNPLTTCDSLVFKPSQDLQNSTSYIAQIGSGNFAFAVDTLLYSVGETTFKTVASPSHMKPSGAICDKGTVKVWQEKDRGIFAQRYEFIFDTNYNPIGEKPYGNEFKVAAAGYYSPDIGASISMNSSCRFAIVYMKDWNYYNLNYAGLFVKEYDWNNSSGNFNYYIPRYSINKNITWPTYVLGLKSNYQMQYDVSSPSVSIIDSGEVTVSVVIPKCYDRGSGMNNKQRFSCDNYVMTWRYPANSTTNPTVLGDNKNTVGNAMTPYGSGFKPTNKIPWLATNMGSYRDLSAGCYNQGAAYDCPYHQWIAGSNYGWLVVWAEGEGNGGGDSGGIEGLTKVYTDDLLWRLFKNDAAATPITSEKLITTKQGTRGYDHWSAGGDLNDYGHIALSGVCKYCSGMQSNPNIQMTDVIGRFANPDGSYKGLEFVVSDKSDYEQYNPSVAINNFDEALYCWKSYGTDCGGYGIYCKLYDWKTGSALTNQFRVNSFNSLVVDTEEDWNVAQSNYEWSFPVSVSTNRKSGDFLITYSYPDRIFLNSASKVGIPASYGQGYSVKSNLFVRIR